MGGRLEVAVVLGRIRPETTARSSGPGGEDGVKLLGHSRLELVVAT